MRTRIHLWGKALVLVGGDGCARGPRRRRGAHGDATRRGATRCARRRSASMGCTPAVLLLAPAAHGWEPSAAVTLAGAAIRAPGCGALRRSAAPHSASEETRTNATPMKRSANQPADPVDA